MSQIVTSQTDEQKSCRFQMKKKVLEKCYENS